MNYVLVYDLLRRFGMFFGVVAASAGVAYFAFEFLGFEPNSDDPELGKIAVARLLLVFLIAGFLWLTCGAIKASMRKVMTEDEIAKGEHDASDEHDESE